MPRAPEKLTKVPEAEVHQIVADYESEGATVKTEKQADGTYTITATFPE